MLRNASTFTARALGFGFAAIFSTGAAFACEGPTCDRLGESGAVFAAKPRPPEIELGPQAFVSPSTDAPGVADACTDGCEGRVPENELGPANQGAPVRPFLYGKTN
jgi:hypothetical protein